MCLLKELSAVLFRRTTSRLIEKGIADSVDKGPMAGYPVVGVKATLFDGSYHPGGFLRDGI